MGIRRVTDADQLVSIKRMLVSTTDTDGLDILIPGIVKFSPNVVIMASGGTYKHIAGVVSREIVANNLIKVFKYTGLPEVAGGLVKTLHHKLFLGYLLEKYCPAHQKDMKKERAEPVDLIVVNLYPFAKVIADGGDPEDARGNIDVGGPSALRAVAKNYLHTSTLNSPEYYAEFLKGLKANQGMTSFAMRFLSFQRTFKYLAEYDTAIAEYAATISVEEAEACYTLH